mgnify:CR=1 FL=1|tara:strand:+ start:13467 stop:15317 length:1851 start_codon:yes stop_codon:yes gene_type:complete
MEEGIMGLNPQMGMPQTQNTNQGPRPEDVQAFEQMRRQVSPKEFSDTTLDSAMAEDPELVGAFKEILQGAEMPQELVMALKQLIQAVLSDPSMYPQLVQALIELGADAEDIPPQFDPSFVSTLALALEEVNVSQPMPEEVQTFSKGGEVSMKPIAKYMASLGRGGDTMLAHINPDEARLLKALGGSGTINPHTGLPEFIRIGNPFRAVGRAISGVGRGISKAVKGVVKGVKKFAKSKIGRLITTMAFAYFAGPAAANFLGLNTLASQAAVTAFVGSTGSGLVAGDGLKNSITSGLKSAAVAGVVAPGISAAMGDPSQGTFLQRYKSGFQEGSGFLGGKENLFKQQKPADVETRTIGQAGQVAPTTPEGELISGMGKYGENVAQVGDPGTRNLASLNENISGAVTDVQSGMNVGINPQTGQPYDVQIDKNAFVKQGVQDALNRLPPSGASDKISFTDYLKDIGSGIKKLGPGGNDFGEGLSQIGGAIAQSPGKSALLGLGALGATGYFTPAAPSPYDLYGIDMRRGYDLYNKNPTQYMVPIPRPAIQYADGGIAQNFPRKSGAINGPGTGTSDDIPAMLSDGEFVFTAKAVRNAGGGDRKKGANKMYSMMKSLERMG